MFKPAFLMFLLLFLEGCTTIWYHPEANSRTYHRDLTRCRSLTKTQWGTCMYNLGWERDRHGWFGNPRWSTSKGGEATVSWEQMSSNEGNNEPKPSATWTNAEVTQDKYLKELGQDKTVCMEKGYVGTKAKGQSGSNISGNGYGFRGESGESFNAEPLFNNELFMACMNGEGWELK